VVLDTFDHRGGGSREIDYTPIKVSGVSVSVCRRRAKSLLAPLALQKIPFCESSQDIIITSGVFCQIVLTYNYFL
jgi:hypothetical protein